VRQQPVHLGLDSALKDVSCVVGSVGQVRVDRFGFYNRPTSRNLQIQASTRIHTDFFYNKKPDFSLNPKP
jgi:hypothetical protein